MSRNFVFFIKIGEGPFLEMNGEIDVIVIFSSESVIFRRCPSVQFKLQFRCKYSNFGTLHMRYKIVGKPHIYGVHSINSIDLPLGQFRGSSYTKLKIVIGHSLSKSSISNFLQKSLSRSSLANGHVGIAFPHT